MYITSTLVSDEDNSGKQTPSQLLSQAKVVAVVDSKASWLFCVLFWTAWTGILERDSMVDAVSPSLTIICLHCPMALVHASARRVPFSFKASFCLSLLTPLSRWPESSSLCARPLAGGSPLFWWHALRSITLILVTPLQMKALYVRPTLSSFDVASHPVNVEDHVQLR